MKINIKDIIAPHFYKTFNSHKMHQIYKGGRGSTKTSMESIKVVYNCINEDNCSAVILRRYQNLLRNSVYKEIKRACKRLGLIENVDYKAYLSPMKITFLTTNNSIYFCGGDDYEAVKGMIDENKLIKIVVFEELTGWDNNDDIDQIIATFTRGNNDWFMAMYSYNPPKNKYNWVNVWSDNMSKRKDCIVSHSDYRTVPVNWLGKMFIDEAHRMENYDNKRFKWIYLGEAIGIEGLIYNRDLLNIVDENYIENNNLDILYIDFAIDSGHQTSATVCGAYGYATDGNWYRLDTYYYSPQEKPRKKAPSELSKDLFTFRNELLKKYKTVVDTETIDSAEGALRNQYYLDYGIKLKPVNKGKNKEELIEYSQEFIDKGKYKILNNKNNWIYIKEMQEYIWKKDSVEKNKPEPDKSEHELKSDELYYNSHSREYSYFYGDHTCDDFQYWVKNNLSKLGLKI